MKRTIPSEILILDVTSSEKLMWPWRKTGGIASFSELLSEFSSKKKH